AAARPAIAVAEVRGDDQLPLASHAHRGDAFVPALDHAAAAEREHERLAAIDRGVELLAALEPAGVVDADGVSGLGPRAGALDEVDVAEAGGGFDDLLVHGLWVPPGADGGEEGRRGLRRGRRGRPAARPAR